MESSEGPYSDDELSDGLGYGHAAFLTTSFDQYFTQNHKAARTSANVFSNILTPLTAQQYTEAIERSTAKRTLEVPWHGAARDLVFSRFCVQLQEGFNLLLYGAGSKRDVLNALAKHINKKRKDVIVVNAFNPGFTIKDLLASIEAMPSFPEQSGSGIEAQTRRIHKHFASTEHELTLIIHNIDAPALRKAQAQSALAVLAANPHIHIAASADTIAFPQLWSLTDAFTRKAAATAADTAPAQGYAWLFHDVTTLAPYDFELAHADRSSLSGASQTGRVARGQKDAVPGTAAGGLVTEVAARHVLLSVTQKAKKLFVLLGTRQLERMGDADASGGAGVGGAAGGAYDPAQIAFDYSMLFNAARDDFIATNDTALRALMGEFKDHGLMVQITQGSGGGEAVWIPLRKDALTKIVHDLKLEQS